MPTKEPKIGEKILYKGKIWTIVEMVGSSLMIQDGANGATIAINQIRATTQDDSAQLLHGAQWVYLHKSHFPDWL